MTKRVETLVRGVCGDPEHALAPFLRHWCGESRAFLAFAQAHATKLRKKARLVRNADELADLQAELSVAALLLGDRRFDLQYEPQHGFGTRGPDFHVTFRTHSSCYVEVTRFRTGTDLTARLARVLCDKISQCPPGEANLLVVFVPPDVAIDHASALAAWRLLERVAGGGDAAPSGLRVERVRAFLSVRAAERDGAVHFASGSVTPNRAALASCGGEAPVAPGCRSRPDTVALSTAGRPDRCGALNGSGRSSLRRSSHCRLIGVLTERGRSCRCLLCPCTTSGG